VGAARRVVAVKRIKWSRGDSERKRQSGAVQSDVCAHATGVWRCRRRRSHPETAARRSRARCDAVCPAQTIVVFASRPTGSTLFLRREDNRYVGGETSGDSSRAITDACLWATG